MQPCVVYSNLEKEYGMNTLHVRSLPDNLYQRLQKLARNRNRSLSAQVVVLLTRAVEEEERQGDQVKALTSIRRRRFSAPVKAPSSLDLLREDRER
jgi:plasmid stability protein